jgi:hypothetical protein
MTNDPPLTADSLSDDPAEAGQQLLEQGVATIDAVDSLRRSIDKSNATQRHRMWATWALILVVVLGVIDNRLQLAELQRQFCPLVVVNIPGQGQARPATQRGRDVEAAARVLAARIGCALP